MYFIGNIGTQTNSQLFLLTLAGTCWENDHSDGHQFNRWIGVCATSLSTLQLLVLPPSWQISVAELSLLTLFETSLPIPSWLPLSTRSCSLSHSVSSAFSSALWIISFALGMFVFPRSLAFPMSAPSAIVSGSSLPRVSGSKSARRPLWKSQSMY